MPMLVCINITFNDKDMHSNHLFPTGLFTIFNLMLQKRWLT